ncbi:LysR substrate-binding domain-containing protein [Saccharibacillus sp. CPCC 101409]|uniref:LysR family transcriptional regulator n=1 Tax=Saccharibacillus sp. CPCC 101409 TaxID=3058041 RepID=UPI0026735409|nr:LysR substrate-binding domain-containing protein [Saccharibacillus sp. CPCC 101409]MDO3411883.1 LysR substrate-binding domain-containing protein [Saccharibacillus sp. CPCC 101409]
MTITQIAIFVRVAETLSFTRTAEELHMTQPAVSHAIAAIEAELDTRLLLRDRRRGVKLTGLGEKVLVQFRAVLQSMDKTGQLIAAEKGIEVGRVSVGAFPSASAYFLPPLIREIRENYPNLQFDLHEGTADEIREGLGERRFDAGLVLLPAPGLDTVALVESRMMLLLPDGHPLRDKPRASIRDLDGQDLLLCRGGHEVAVLEAFERAGSRAKITFTTQNVSTMVGMVSQGLGIGIISEIALSMHPHALEVREIVPPIVRGIGVGVPSLEDVSPAVRLFIETAARLFAEADVSVV